jgi:CheY-like chemotaxis protein/nitrogen-specific signal transduction histidine kinase
MMNWLKPWEGQQKAYDAQRQRHAALTAEQQALLQTTAQSQQLMATVSHALRTPMNAILGFMHLLQTTADDVPDALDLLKNMRRSTDHLLTVINDVLDDASLDTGTIVLQTEPCALRDSLSIAFDLFRMRAQEAGLHYSCEVDDAVPTLITTDRHRLTQVLVNLLGNAIKFTSQGHVTLRVQQTVEGIKFSVEDSGVGISEADQTRIFERFKRADIKTQPRYAGYGLGLSISQRLVVCMGGRMDVQSTLRQGSTFAFTLPHSTAVLPEPASTAGGLATDVKFKIDNEPPQEALTFLVVDDHAINRLLLSQLLKAHWTQCQVLTAESGTHALGMLQQHRIDAVLMDMVMPEMDGIEALQALRQNPHGQDIPVLGLTANIHPQDLARFRAAGVNALVLKPFDAATLCTQIGQLLREKKSSQGS